MYYIILFCSRNNAFRFYDALMQEGIDAQIVNTPKFAQMSCSISVKVYDHTQAKRILSYGRYSSYQGILQVIEENGNTHYAKID